MQRNQIIVIIFAKKSCVATKRGEGGWSKTGAQPGP